MNSEYKILLTYKNGEGDIEVESVWAIKQGGNYKVVNIPFFAPNISWGDIVSVEMDGEELHFDEMIERSGHSTLQLIVFEKKYLVEVFELLKKFECGWEGSHLETYISIDVPRDVDYKSLKFYLDKGELEGLWSYKEACLSHET